MLRKLEDSEKVVIKMFDNENIIMYIILNITIINRDKDRVFCRAQYIGLNCSKNCVTS